MDSAAFHMAWRRLLMKVWLYYGHLARKEVLPFRVQLTRKHWLTCDHAEAKGRIQCWFPEKHDDVGHAATSLNLNRAIIGSICDCVTS